ncbi:holin [Paenibacillus albiflavus]|uniref:Holin n=1 Tax=Paenibacillus albiflavus TaxID=2545760 RepID=A0A4R4DYR5_9BACL|nr:phage holin family protein [Paenibacillus albiflavus]TCZ70982.1 holin [Paenibacillus albiflavus]
MQPIFNSFVGAIGLLATYAFGGWSELLSFFLIVMVIDYGTGIAASIKEKKGLSSEVGFWGLIKKILMIIIVFLSHRADVALNLDIVMYGVIYAFLANELISIVENYGRLGLPLPNTFKNLITILKDKEGKADER